MDADTNIVIVGRVGAGEGRRVERGQMVMEKMQVKFFKKRNQ